MQQNYESLVAYSVQRWSKFLAQVSHAELFLRIKALGLDFLNQIIKIQNTVKLKSRYAPSLKTSLSNCLLGCGKGLGSGSRYLINILNILIQETHALSVVLVILKIKVISIK